MDPNARDRPTDRPTDANANARASSRVTSSHGAPRGFTTRCDVGGGEDDARVVVIHDSYSLMYGMYVLIVRVVVCT